MVNPLTSNRVSFRSIAQLPKKRLTALSQKTTMMIGCLISMAACPWVLGWRSAIVEEKTKRKRVKARGCSTKHGLEECSFSLPTKVAAVRQPIASLLWKKGWFSTREKRWRKQRKWRERHGKERQRNKPFYEEGYFKLKRTTEDNPQFSNRYTSPVDVPRKL